FGLAFALAPYPTFIEYLTGLAPLTRRIILQQARGRAFLWLPRGIALPLLVNTRFQVLFHSPSGVLFTFPSRYLFTIGRQRVFSLGGWSPRIPARFHVPDSTLDTYQKLDVFRLQDYHLLWSAFPCRSAILELITFPH